MALLTNLGQRMSREAGVDDVTPYSAVPSMPARIQLKETIAQLREADGTKVFFQEMPGVWPEIIPALKNYGYRQVAESEPPLPEGEVAPNRMVLFSDAPR